MESLYQMTVNQSDYINPTAEGNISWQCDSSSALDSDVGLENWQNRLHEVSARRCAYLTKSLRWIGAEINEIPFMVLQISRTSLSSVSKIFLTSRGS